jgi:hypothetical protein
MGRSLADLAALATDPNLDPFERMCHAATLTNRAHAASRHSRPYVRRPGRGDLGGPGERAGHVSRGRGPPGRLGATVPWWRWLSVGGRPERGAVPGGARCAALRSGRRSRSVLPSSFRHRPRSPRSTQHQPTRATNPDHQTMYLPGAVIQNRTRPGGAEPPTLWAARDHRNPLPSYVAISSKAPPS